MPGRPRVGRKCLGCSLKVCRTAYLYVVADDTRHLVKIGCSINVANRLHQYRAMGNSVRLIHKQDGGCPFTAPIKEERALKRLDQSTRVRGDWFATTENAAVAAVMGVLS